MERDEYDVYGAATIFDNTDTPLTASVIGNPYLFTGRRYDPESGNYYYRARMYSPTLGRFLQTDPLGYVDGLNLYAYVLNNPASWVDPSGTMTGVEVAALLMLASAVTEVYMLSPHAQEAREALAHDIAMVTEMVGDFWDDFTKYSPPPYPAYRVPGPEPMIFVPADEAARQNIPGSPSPEACPTPDPGPLVNPIPGDDPVFDPRIIDPFPGNDPVFDPVMASESGDEFVSVFHGSADDATTILKKGLDPTRTSPTDPTWVSRDRDAAMNAITKRYAPPKDPGIIESRIPKDQFDKVIRPSERKYPSGFGGEQLNSTEIILKTQDQVHQFNNYIVR